MKLAETSIKRPKFIFSLVVLMLVTGYISLKSMAVDLYPNVSLPYIIINTIYPGAAPDEIENLVSKPIEDALGTLSGLKHITSYNAEGVSRVITEFTLETDIKYAEQKIRDQISVTKGKLPKDIKEPIIQQMNPADYPIMMISLEGELNDFSMFDLADQTIRPRLEQILGVGDVKIYGGREREIQVLLNRKKLKDYDLSATLVASRLGAAGENIPLGKVERSGKEIIYRSMAQFKTIDKIKSVIVKFLGNDISTSVGDIATVVDSLKTDTTKAYINGKKALLLHVHKQSGANTVAVAKELIKKINEINEDLKLNPGSPKLTLIRDGSVPIRDNVYDVRETIVIGIILAVFVVFFFLANFRSTIITGLALPNSLLGAFIFMAWAGFSINLLSLLALSLVVGLLIDDAIVVRENIFRHMELGETPKEAAVNGTKEVTMAVIATTFSILAVFGAIAFVKGIVGQFLKEFGLTVCFAMFISLFDALTIAPCLSAHFASINEEKEKKNYITKFIDLILGGFDKMQTYLSNQYAKFLKIVLRIPITTISISLLIFVITIFSAKWIPFTFLPTQDTGEFLVELELPAGTSLNSMDETAQKIVKILHNHKEVALTSLTVGDWTGKINISQIYVKLASYKLRGMMTSQFKEILRKELKGFSSAKLKIKDYDPLFSGLRPFTLNLVGDDTEKLEEYSEKLLSYLRLYPKLKEVDSNLERGKPEFQVRLNNLAAEQYGISGNVMGGELRAQIEGIAASKFREGNKEYDIRVKLQDEDRDLEKNFDKTYIPNVNGRLIALPKIATGIKAKGLAMISRQDRARFIQISGDPVEGYGLGNILADIKNILTNDPNYKTPPGVHYRFVGQGESFGEMKEGFLLAAILGIIFIYLVLTSLYESFLTPFTIMLALPLSMCGAFVALFVTNESLNIFSLIACIMLLGVATKNSILLVDCANQLINEGRKVRDSIIEAGRIRLRPILMTTMALIAGTIPVAIGLNESSRQRTSMGMALLGGLISSTLLTLVVIPAAHLLIEKLKRKIKKNEATN